MIRIAPDYDGNGPPPVIAELLDARFAGRELVEVLDAGCGDECRVLPRAPLRVVGIDASEHQLARNRSLDERIAADLDQLEIPPDAYDLVVCWNVLEHLGRPLQTIGQLARAVRPGGALVLAWPNLRSLKATLARRLPHSAHVALFRKLYPNADVEEDNGPFPTVLDRALTPERVEALLTDAGLTLHALIAYECEMQRKARQRLRLTGAAWRAASGLMRTVGVEPEQTDYVALFLKD